MSLNYPFYGWHTTRRLYFDEPLAVGKNTYIVENYPSENAYASQEEWGWKQLQKDVR